MALEPIGAAQQPESADELVGWSLAQHLNAMGACLDLLESSLSPPSRQKVAVGAVRYWVNLMRAHLTHAENVHKSHRT